MGSDQESLYDNFDLFGERAVALGGLREIPRTSYRLLDGSNGNDESGQWYRDGKNRRFCVTKAEKHFSNGDVLRSNCLYEEGMLLLSCSTITSASGRVERRVRPGNDGSKDFVRRLYWEAKRRQ